jgi:MoxR-like ATPase
MLVTLEYIREDRRTAFGVLLVFKNHAENFVPFLYPEVWLPLSKVQIDVFHKTVTVPDWLWNKKIEELRKTYTTQTIEIHEIITESIMPKSMTKALKRAHKENMEGYKSLMGQRGDGEMETENFAVQPGKINAVRLMLLKEPKKHFWDTVRDRFNLNGREQEALKKRISCLQDGTLVWIEKQVKRIPILPQRETAVAYEEKKYIPRRFCGRTDIEIIKTCFDAHLNVLLVGESGTGKNAAVKAFCEKYGLTYHRISLNGASTVEDMIGTKELEQGLNTSFRDGIVTYAVRNGGVVVLDEVNAAAPEQMFVIHQLLDADRTLTLTQTGEGGERIQAHKNFFCVATMNPSSYAGTRELNKAFLDRFDVVLNFTWNYEIEKKLIDDDEKLLSFARNVRQLYQSLQITTPVTTRTLIQFKRNQALLGTEIACEVLKGKFPAEEHSAIGNFLQLLYEKPEGKV